MVSVDAVMRAVTTAVGAITISLPVISPCTSRPFRRILENRAGLSSSARSYFFVRSAA